MNTSTVNLLIQLIMQIGAWPFVGVLVILFIFIITYKILQKYGLFTRKDYVLLKEISDKLSNLSSSLDRVLEKQHSYLSEDQSYIVLELSAGVYIYRLLKKVMEIYSANNLKNMETTKSIVFNEMETIVRNQDRDIDTIPNVKHLLIPTKEKIKSLDDIVQDIVQIMYEFKNEKDVSRKIKSIISTTVNNRWIYSNIIFDKVC